MGWVAPRIINLGFRDWSLITGGSGYKTGEGGGMGSFTPMKRGDRKRSSHAEGGGGHGSLKF